jgi:ATP-dependent exoDNAse (exonuclease V) beta subunit
MPDGVASPLPDRVARERVRSELAATLFVEAGAGSGKTTALVDRLVALVDEDEVELRSVAAITFTEKAGAELRDRLRHALEQRAAGASTDPASAARLRLAHDQLDGAAIGTLHSFAQRVLGEHPVEAGLPPRVEVLDEVSSGVEFDRRWSAFRDELLADAELERTLVLFFAAGVREEALRALAVAFDLNWDLVDERIPEHAPDPPPLHDKFGEVAAELERVCAAREHGQAGDRLFDRLCDIADHVHRLRTLDDEADLLEALAEGGQGQAPSFRVGNVGQAKKWAIDVKALREEVAAAGSALGALREEVAQVCAHRIASEVRRFTLEAAAERRADGRLEFHDLLVLARRLLRHPEHGAAVRRDVHRRYQRLLLDEFQDTDPIQIELAVRIAAADPGSDAAGSAPWHEVDLRPGSLFVVGDPKQSIYRFRRADITTFLAARDRLAPSPADVVALTANFRTVAPIIDFVNDTLGALMTEPRPADVDAPPQADYVALQAVRGSPPGGPAVAVLGRLAHPDPVRADDLRAAEAADVASTIRRVLDEQWSVQDGAGWRGARLGDITILLPARTSLPFLEDALEAAAIPFRAESSSLVYASRAVRDLLMVLRAVDDPTDELRTVAALRTALLGCGDDDLFRWKADHAGRWSFFADPPPTASADDPVALGLGYLRSLHRERRWRTPSELLDRLARDRRALELGFAEGRPRDVWRRLRFVIDQARAWSEATGGSLREYLYWVDQQTVEGARVAEAVLPETDDDAVRIMTIHAAKGLEFPVTILSGLTTAPQSRQAPAQVVFPPRGGVGYRFGRHVTTEEWKEFAPVDEQMGYDERIRLLYVACTRARDHLVVSLHRRARANPPDADKRTNAELLHDGIGERLGELPDGAADGHERATSAGPAAVPVPPPPLALDDWRAERDAALARASLPVTVAATALTDEALPDADAPDLHGTGVDDTDLDDTDLHDTDLDGADGGVDGGYAAGEVLDRPPDLAGPGGVVPGRRAIVDPGLQKRPQDLDLPPWLKGRYGTAVGRAVHGALQTVDLATGAGLEAAVAAQCEAEAVPDRVDDVLRLARAALASPAVRTAAALPHWREVYGCIPTGGGRLLEGYVDLLYRSAGGGLVVLDYKTAATTDAGELDRRTARYRLQGASYAVIMAESTGEPVTAVTFVYLTPGGAVERTLDDLPAATDEVRRLVVSGREVLTP